jgi:hypothetical protein
VCLNLGASQSSISWGSTVHNVLLVCGADPGFSFWLLFFFALCASVAGYSKFWDGARFFKDHRMLHV